MSTSRKINKAFSALFVLLIPLLLTACSPSGIGSDAFPKTSSYLFSKFSSEGYLDPFATGKPDAGGTLEAMIQLSGVGYDKNKQSKAIEWAKKNTDLLTSPGLKGEYIFASHALGFAEDATVSTVLKDLKAVIGSDGSVPDTNNFSYSWVVFGLAAAGEKDLANKVSVKLASLNETNGSYKYMTHEASIQSTVDVTGFAIMSMKATEGYGSEADEASKTLAIGRASAWMQRTAISKQFWIANGDVDTNSTAYGMMALTALKEKTDTYVDWMKTRLNKKDSGVLVPWTEPESDIFTTAQSILALSKLNFIDVLKHNQ